MSDHVQAHSVPALVNLAVIVGNGFTMDCMAQLGMRGPDASRPVDWPIRIPAQPELSIREALPHFFKAFASLQQAGERTSQFDLLRAIVGAEENDGKAEVEARHFLTLAYRFLTAVLLSGPLHQWRWMQWFQAYAHVLATTVSFNYDCLLECVLHVAARQYDRQHNVKPGIVRVFKPHGSADFDLSGLTRGPLSYPLNVFARMNNFPLRIVPFEEWSQPPAEPLIVVPYESNPYTAYQWAQPGYSNFGQIAPNLTHCVFVGLSYHEADRAEIDHFLFSTPQQCRIILADCAPPPDFVTAIRASGHEPYVWLDGPEDLPLG